jgi:hypothetical protein
LCRFLYSPSVIRVPATKASTTKNKLISHSLLFFLSTRKAGGKASIVVILDWFRMSLLALSMFKRLKIKYLIPYSTYRLVSSTLSTFLPPFYPITNLHVQSLFPYLHSFAHTCGSTYQTSSSTRSTQTCHTHNTAFVLHYPGGQSTHSSPWLQEREKVE